MVAGLGVLAYAVLAAQDSLPEESLPGGAETPPVPVLCVSWNLDRDGSIARGDLEEALIFALRRALADVPLDPSFCPSRPAAASPPLGESLTLDLDVRGLQVAAPLRPEATRELREILDRAAISRSAMQRHALEARRLQSAISQRWKEPSRVWSSSETADEPVRGGGILPVRVGPSDTELQRALQDAQRKHRLAEEEVRRLSTRADAVRLDGRASSGVAAQAHVIWALSGPGLSPAAGDQWLSAALPAPASAGNPADRRSAVVELFTHLAEAVSPRLRSWRPGHTRS